MPAGLRLECRLEWRRLLVDLAKVVRRPDRLLRLLVAIGSLL